MFLHGRMAGLFFPNRAEERLQCQMSHLTNFYSRPSRTKHEREKMFRKPPGFISVLLFTCGLLSLAQAERPVLEAFRSVRPAIKQRMAQNRSSFACEDGTCKTAKSLASPTVLASNSPPLAGSTLAQQTASDGKPTKTNVKPVGSMDSLTLSAALAAKAELFVRQQIVKDDGTVVDTFLLITIDSISDTEVVTRGR